MHQTQLVLNVFQCISVSLAIPVRMEHHVISVLTATTTPALVRLTIQDRIVTVSKHNTLYIIAISIDVKFLNFRVCSHLSNEL